MRIVIEAAPGELRHKSAELLSRLSASLQAHAPDAAERLHKALPPISPRPPQSIVMRALKERLVAAYAAQMRRMLAEVSKVLTEAHQQARKGAPRRLTVRPKASGC